MKKRNLVIANWKMNPETLEDAKKLWNTLRISAKKLRNTDVLVCPPYPFIFPLAKLDHPKNIFFCAQNIASEMKGAFTGEVSASQVKNVGAKFVLIGHSERRAMGEIGETVNKKLRIAFDAGLTPVLCIGEKERDGEGGHISIIKNQIKESLVDLPKKHLVGIIIAYEPVWAIGKSYREAMTPTDIHEMTLLIKKIMSELFGKDIAAGCKILYGAAVEAESVEQIMKYGNISGLLVGHASLLPEFSDILKSADAVK
jgi:triosephosphate isomerase